jgi:Replication-relaxation
MIDMRSWENAAPALACLTSRDRVLLRVLNDLRYLTCEQVHRTCYAGMESASARARLSELKRRGLLRRLRRSAVSDRRGFWSLAPLGRTASAALEAAEHGPDAVEHAGTARLAVLAAIQLEHVIGVNELFCALWQMRSDGRLPSLRWLAGHRAAVDLGHTHLVPDGCILVDGPEGWWVYYVERDRGTMSFQAIGEKLDRYRLLFTAATAQSDDPDWRVRADAWVLFACDDVRRAHRLAAAATAAGLERVWAGAADACASGLAASLDGVPRRRNCAILPAWARAALVLAGTASEEHPI